MKKKNSMEKIQILWDKYRETVVYLIVGLAVTCINWFIYTILSSILYVDVNVSNIVAWIVAVLTAYFLNKVYVFRSFCWKKNVLYKEFISFLSGRIFTGVIEILMVPMLLYFGLKQTLFGVVAGWAKACACVVGVVLNYFISKKLVFKN